MKKNRTKGILEIIIGVVLVALGIIMIPGVTSLSDILLFITLGCLLLAYTIGYLFLKVILKNKGSFLIISLVEFIVLTFIAVGTILKPWVNIPVITEVCNIVGMAFWFRGVAEILRIAVTHEYHKSNAYKTAVNVGLITVGTWFFVKPLFTNNQLIYGFICLIFVLAILFVVIGILRINNKLINK